MAKVIFSMTAGVPHGDDYTQPTGDTPISLGEVEGKSGDIDRPKHCQGCS